MVQEIVFHLGDCKTGTTSVQAVLAQDAWKGGSLCYPARVNHIPVAKTLTAESERPFEAKRFGELANAFDISDAEVGVVSAEHFEFVDPKALAGAIARHMPQYEGRIRLIAYVRPHASRLMSTFAERSKKGLFHKPPAAMHKKLLQDGMLFYTPRFEKWRQVFGEAFTLRPFVPSVLHKSDVVQDFFRFVLGHDDYTLTRPTQQNESLSVQDIVMMRFLHARIRALSPKGESSIRQAQQALGWYLPELLAAKPHNGGQKLQLHRKLARQAAEAYRADAAALDAAFFDGTPMSDALAAAPEKAADKPQSFKAEEHFSGAELRRLEAVADMFQRIAEAHPDHFMWAVRSPAQRSKLPPRLR